MTPTLEIWVTEYGFIYKLVAFVKDDRWHEVRGDTRARDMDDARAIQRDRLARLNAPSPR